MIPRSRLSTAIAFLRNNRLEDYQHILAAARDAGYIITSVRDAAERLRGDTPAGKLLVLRHDIDHVSPATLRLAELERAISAEATYYFRWRTLDLDTVRRLHDMGHECSLHFETIADVVQQKRLRPEDVRIEGPLLQECLTRLKDEISQFEDRCRQAGIDIEIRTMAAHGHAVNRTIGYPGNRLFRDAPAGFFGEVVEAYDPALLDRFDIYISDSNLRLCNGFRYGVHPLKAIAEERSIIFLSHPNHWWYSPMGRLRQAASALILGVETTPQTFQS